MIYSIATIKDFLFDQTVDLNKKGNRYQIVFYQSEKRNYTYKEFDTLEEAKKVFTRLSGAIIEGSYSYEDRKAILLD